MPKVKVRLYASFRNIADKGELEIKAHRVSELINVLEEKIGEKFRKELLDTDGKLRPFHSILINGIRIDLLNNFDTELKKDDVVAFFSPIGGGCARNP